MALINCSICLSDIPADRIKLFDKNGKKYLSIVVADLREADEYGNTHSTPISGEERRCPSNRANSRALTRWRRCLLRTSWMIFHSNG